MADIKKYIWIIPLVAGIFALIAVVTPAVSMNFLGMLTANLWFWGLYLYDYTGFFSGTDFIMDPLVLIPSLITTILISLSGVLLVAAGAKLKRDNNKLGFVRNFSAISGVLILIGEILWLVMVPMFFPMAYYWDAVFAPYPYTFWTLNMGIINMNLHAAGFGVIGGFIAAGMAFGAVGAASYYSKERPMKTPKKKEVTPMTKETTSEKEAELKFCPECGAKIEDPNIKFCGKCGFEFKTPELSPL